MVDEQGFQCAFCMPGFVMAAAGFLKTNPNPTREELAHGVSGNLCRCQDYDKILTALMRGAEYMRKHVAMAEKLIGQNYTPPDHVAKVTGRARYAEDFRAEGMLFTKLLLSPMPHARVRSIDTSAALAMPGVKAILTADDLPDLNGAERALTNEPLYAGEPILAVAAVDELTAAEAVEAIQVDLEPLPFVTDPLDSLRPDGPNAHLDGNAWGAPVPAARVRPRRRRGRRSSGPAEDFARRRRGTPADGEGARGMVVWRPRRRLRRRRARSRRNVRHAVDRAPPDGNAQRDGVLAERQAVHPRVHAERRRRRAATSRAGSASSRPT